MTTDTDRVDNTEFMGDSYEGNAPSLSIANSDLHFLLFFILAPFAGCELLNSNMVTIILFIFYFPS